MRYTFTLFTLVLASYCYGQLGHYILSSHAGQTGPIGDIDNLSWSIGEPVVFNTDLTATSNASVGFTIAQAMQSYPTSPIVVQCPKIRLSASSHILCTNFTTLQLNYTISYSPDTALKADTVQWYFSSGDTTDISKFSKIAGAQSATFTPYFPGFYAVRLAFNGLACGSVFSPSFKVSNYTSDVASPTIVKSGDVLTANADTKMGACTLQWYAYINSLGKYLLVAGGTSADLKVRYNANYMVVASYTNGCMLSSVYTVGEYTTDLFRAQDTRIDGNTIYIPEEAPDQNVSLTVYPNPATGSFLVNYRSPSEINSKLQIYTDAGVFLKEVEFSEGSAWSKSAKVSTDQMSAGLYLVKVTEEGKSLVQKVMVYK